MLLSVPVQLVRKNPQLPVANKYNNCVVLVARAYQPWTERRKRGEDNIHYSHNNATSAILRLGRRFM